MPDNANSVTGRAAPCDQCRSVKKFVFPNKDLGPDPLQRRRDHDFSMGWQRTALRRVGFAVAFAEPACKHQKARAGLGGGPPTVCEQVRVQTGTPAPSDRVIRRCGPVRTTQLHVPTLFFLPAAKSRGLHLPSPACAGLVFAAGQVSLAQARLCNCCPRLQPPGVIVVLPPIRSMSADRQQSCVMSKLNVTGIGSAGAPVRPGDAQPGDARPGIAVGMNSAATGNGVGLRRRPAGFCHVGDATGLGAAV